MFWVVSSARIGSIGRRVVWEVREGRELACFRHNKLNKVLWDIQMYLFTYQLTSGVKFRREVCAKGVTMGWVITDAKEIIQEVLLSNKMQ